MDEISVSIIVPVYNSEKYIKRCLDSILAQSFKEFELFLVNDGSTDSSGEICEGYAAKDPRIIVLNKKNGGVSSARNLGLKHARGKFIAFIDSDDYVEPRYLEELINAGADLTVCGFRSIEGINYAPEARFLNRSDIQTHIEDIVLDCVSLCTPWSKLFVRSVIEKNSLSFDEEMRLEEDTLFVYTYMKYCQSIQMVDNSYYFYDGIWGGQGKCYLSWDEVVSNVKKKYYCLMSLGEAYDNYSLNEDCACTPRYYQMTDLYDDTNLQECYHLYCNYVKKIELTDFLYNIISVTRLAEKLVASIKDRTYLGFSKTFRKFVNVKFCDLPIEGKLNRFCCAMAYYKLNFLYPVAVAWILYRKLSCYLGCKV